MSAARLQPGERLGAFEILGFISEGGMGTVYRARNRVSGELRALKLVLPEFAAQPDFIARFVREIRLAAAVEHPNLVRVFEPSMDGDRIFLPMELLEGETLADRLDREGAVGVGAMLAVIVPVCRAVAMVHARGIIHRDLKPANIFLARDQHGRIVPKVLDFGAARPTSTDMVSTAIGAVIGSAHYMPYEQARGSADIDARADQYALGALAYEMLTGMMPYHGDDSRVALTKIIQGVPIPPVRQLSPSVPAPIEAAVMKALARARDDRFPNTGAFADALEAAAGVGQVASSFEADLLSPTADAASATVVLPSSGARGSAPAPPPRAPQAAPHAPAPAVPQQAAQRSALLTTGWIVAGMLFLAALSIAAGAAWRQHKLRSRQLTPPATATAQPR